MALYQKSPFCSFLSRRSLTIIQKLLRQHLELPVTVTGKNRLKVENIRLCYITVINMAKGDNPEGRDLPLISVVIRSNSLWGINVG